MKKIIKHEKQHKMITIDFRLLETVAFYLDERRNKWLEILKGLRLKSKGMLLH